MGFGDVFLRNRIVGNENVLQIWGAGRFPSAPSPGAPLDQLAEKYLERGAPGGSFVCLICAKLCQDKTVGKYHLEAKHFPSEEGYFCDVCGKHLKSQNSLKCHLYQTHTKEEREAAKLNPTFVWNKTP